MRASVSLAVGIILLGGVRIAPASPLSAFRLANASICLGTSTTATTACDISSEFSEVSNGTASLMGSFGSAAVGSQMTIDATAASSYGVLRAGVSSTLNLSGTPRVGVAAGVAGFQDIITINYLLDTGLPGLLFVDYTLDGTISTSGADGSFAEVEVDVGPSLEQEQSYGQLYASSTAGLFAIPETFHFVFGQPFILAFNLYTLNGTMTPVLTSTPPESFALYALTGGIGRGSASANFSNTLVLSGLTVEDQFGNPVPDATFTSASGTQYGPHGVVPEPNSATLISSALALILILFGRNLPKRIQMRP